MKTPRLTLAAATLLAALLAFIPGAGVRQATAQSSTLRVVIKPLAPFVSYLGDRNVGFSIDLWEEIARRLNRKFEYVRVETVTQQIESLRDNRADVAITGISITRERETQIDFSLPYFDAGLQIMVPAKSGTPSLWALVATFFSANVLQIVFVVTFFIFAVALVFWLTERNRAPDFPKGIVHGFGEALWWACVTVVTVGYGDRVPRTQLGRIVAVFWMFIGLFLISNFTATITSELTLRQLQGNIDTIDDLSDKRVLTVIGSTAQRYLERIGIPHRTVAAVEEAYPLLESGQADAIVYDSPVLRNYVLRSGAGKVRIVGTIFNHEAYGIALQQDSGLREEINRVLLAIREDGTYGQIHERWFGASP